MVLCEQTKHYNVNLFSPIPAVVKLSFLICKICKSSKRCLVSCVIVQSCVCQQTTSSAPYRSRFTRLKEREAISSPLLIIVYLLIQDGYSTPTYKILLDFPIFPFIIATKINRQGTTTMRKLPLITLCFIATLIPLTSSSTEKVTICHKGKTITLSEAALLKHLKHGDTLGECSETEVETETEVEVEVEVETEVETEPQARKVTICHKGKTITLSEAALLKHLKHGDTFGRCSKAKKEWKKGSKRKRGSKGKKGSKRKRGSKGQKGSKGKR